MVLDECFIQKCREAFNTFDADGSGTIDTQEMKLLLEAIGEAPTEEELFRFMADVDEDGTGEIEFAEFLRAFEKQRGGTEMGEDDCEITYAFCACGGGIQANEKEGIAENLKEGFVEQGPLAAIIRDFGMTIKVGRLFEELDKDRDGKLSFTEFAALFQ